MSMYTIDELIKKKQKSLQHSISEFEFLINGFISNKIPDYQMASWLATVFLNDMSFQEISDYTSVMINSGKKMDFSDLPGPVVDKHSTGGVGDKVSLILGPILSACGLYVPMISGRALGHTGGTLDKLETIPGYKTDLSLENYRKIVKEIGFSLIGQTDDICPADRKIYALRDVTSTVASLPLISGSIMSKKITEGIQGLVLDVKTGNGAFMKTHADAKKLAELLTKIGQNHGLRVSSLITDMNQPLGNSSGLWCEVQESIDALQGNGPKDLMEVVYSLCEEALSLFDPYCDNRQKVEEVVSNGSAMEKFLELVSAHGGNVEQMLNNKLHQPKFNETIVSQQKGYISEMDTYKLGLSIIELGGGRKKQDDVLDNSAGFTFHKKIGDSIEKEEPIAEVFCSDSSKLDRGKISIQQAIKISQMHPKPIRLIY